MRRLGARSTAEAIDYHLKRNHAPEFDAEQPGRIDLARFLIEKMLLKDLPRRPLRFVELGCGAGDITGPYSIPRRLVTVRGEIDTEGIEVHGYDMVPAAIEACERRFPQMVTHLEAVERAEPIDCDLLVMCEFLEHVTDPEAVVKAWLPRAKWAIVGHPLDEPDPPYEFGHNWSYSRDDWRRWFELGGHHVWEEFRFPMGYWDAMVMGHSCRLDQMP